MENVQNGNSEANEQEAEEENTIKNDKEESENLATNQKNEDNADIEIEKDEEPEENQEEIQEISNSQHALNDSSKKIAKKNYFQRMDHSRLHHLKDELKDNTFLVCLFIVIIIK